MTAPLPARDDIRIAVIGLGYVGLPVAAGMARAHGDVVGFDVKAGRVEDLRRGVDATWELDAGELAGLDLRSKSRKGRDGREIGARLLGRGQLHYLLTNPVYRGRTRHGAAEHEGQHPPLSTKRSGAGSRIGCSSAPGGPAEAGQRPMRSKCR